jgi:HK97 family phage prohead protease
MTEPRELLRRMVSVEVEAASDGRTLEGRLVPFNEPAKVHDPGGPPYVELFAPGCFRRQLTAPNRVSLRFEHRDGLTDRLGRGLELWEDDAATWGRFKVAEGPIGDHALALVDDGVVSGFSVGFIPRRARRNEQGQVVRTLCSLEEVSLVPEPAYAGTEVVRRARSDYGVPLGPDPAQVERLRRVGIEVVSFDA